jgi:hypothetical protein
MSYCLRHLEQADETLGYCWRCLAEEVDPPDRGYGSWWWRQGGYDFCVCVHPRPYEGYCLRCAMKLLPGTGLAVAAKQAA